MTKLNVRCPAKVNLGLAVNGKRPDGFHDVETYLAAITVGDALVIEPHQRLELTLSGVGNLPTDRRNLVYRAAELFLRTAGLEDGARLRLVKRIPPGTGLGGGSSDAAATLLGLNHLHGEPLGLDELRSLAAELGSDVPFFLGGGTAFAHGRGEIIEERRSDGEKHLVLALPQAAVSTSWAYRQLTDEDFFRLETSPIEGWLAGGPPPGELPNSFTGPVAGTFPVINECLERLRSVGLRCVTLTGSGAACFGLAEDAEQASRCARELESRGLAALPTQITGRGVTISEDP